MNILLIVMCKEIDIPLMELHIVNKAGCSSSFFSVNSKNNFIACTLSTYLHDMTIATVTYFVSMFFTYNNCNTCDLILEDD